MLLHLTRGSVAMGDDACAPHARDVELPDGATLGDALRWIDEHHYCASVQGGSTWAVRVRHASDETGPAVAEALAVIGREPDRTVCVADPATPLSDPSHLHLDYLLHQDLAATVGLVRSDPRRANLRLR